MGPKELSREQSVCSLGTAYDRFFATQENKKAMLFCSWIPFQHAFALDALSVA